MLLLQLTLFESIDVFSLMELKAKESKLQQEMNEIEKKIEETRLQAKSLSDPEVREQFARERYHFKRPGEKIFVISNE